MSGCRGSSRRPSKRVIEVKLRPQTCDLNELYLSLHTFQEASVLPLSQGVLGTQEGLIATLIPEDLLIAAVAGADGIRSVGTVRLCG